MKEEWHVDKWWIGNLSVWVALVYGVILRLKICVRIRSVVENFGLITLLIRHCSFLDLNWIANDLENVDMIYRSEGSVLVVLQSNWVSSWGYWIFSNLVRGLQQWFGMRFCSSLVCGLCMVMFSVLTIWREWRWTWDVLGDGMRFGDSVIIWSFKGWENEFL